MAHAEDPVIPPRLDQTLGFIIEQAGWYVPDGGHPSPEIAGVFARNHRGLCALCETELAENTLLVMDSSGLQIGFCTPACQQDFHVMNWMMEEYDRMIQMVKIRNAQGAADAEEEAAGIEEDPRTEEGEPQEEEAGGTRELTGDDAEGARERDVEEAGTDEEAGGEEREDESGNPFGDEGEDDPEGQDPPA